MTVRGLTNSPVPIVGEGNALRVPDTTELRSICVPSRLACPNKKHGGRQQFIHSGRVHDVS